MSVKFLTAARWSLTAVALTVCFHSPVSAQRPREATHSVIWENDTIADTDRQYTNGLQYARMRPRADLPVWSRWFFGRMTPCGPGRQENCHDVRSGFVIGQLIYTPDDIGVSDPIFNDRPYGGWLYGGVSVDIANRALTRAHRLEFSIGVLGEESLAEEAQTTIHELFGFRRPRGWDNQLDFEPGLEVQYEWTQALLSARYSRDRRWFDLSLGLGATLGNVFANGHAGLTGRIGWNISESLGNVSIQPVAIDRGEFELYFFFRTRAVGVARNHFLEEDDRFQIDKNDEFNEVTTGVVFSRASYQIAYNVVTRSPEFSPRELQHRYGSLRFTWNRPF